MKSHISDNELVKYATCKDFLVTGEEFDLFIDNETELIQTIPQPDKSKIASYYESDEYLSHNTSALTLTSKIYDLVKQVNIRSKFATVEKYFNGKFSLLDIGCGVGDFLIYAKENKCDIDGMEPSDKARSIASKRLNKEIKSGDDLSVFEDNSFDTITMWHVLEHRYDINETIDHLKRICKSDGYIVLALPNYKSFDGNYYKNNWAAFDVPRHLYHFSQNTVKYLAEKNELELIETRPMWFDSFYVSILSEKNMDKKVNFIKGIFIGAISSLYYLFTKESSSHIYILKNK
jgi:ubiquinone/menaquinone biosynthesis C-methylase UbiE